jgi:hypothetical protein
MRATPYGSTTAAITHQTDSRGPARLQLQRQEQGRHIAHPWNRDCQRSHAVLKNNPSAGMGKKSAQRAEHRLVHPIGPGMRAAGHPLEHNRLGQDRAPAAPVFPRRALVPFPVDAATFRGSLMQPAQMPVGSTDNGSTATKPYLATLITAVILNLTLRIRIAEHFLEAHLAAQPAATLFQRGLLVLFVLLFLAFWWVVLSRLLPQQRRSIPPRRNQLLLLAKLASGMVAANISSESLALYRLNLSSYSLMLESLILYISVTLVFLFWYWLIDNPPRFQGGLWEQRHVDQPTPALSTPYGIVFPEETLERFVQQSDHWKPSFIDYLYFTILCSNCFAPPEGHLLVGNSIKKLHVLHSMTMIVVFIVMLARAINTLN